MFHFVKLIGHLPTWMPPKRGVAVHYLLTIMLMLLALWVRLEIAPVEAGLQYVTFFPAVTMAALLGGFGAGVMATFLGLCFATFIFTPPFYTVSLEVVKMSVWSNLVFLADGFIVSFTIEVMHRYRERYAFELQKSLETHSVLVDSNQHLKNILDNLFAYVALLDVHGNILEVNKAALDRSGYQNVVVTGQKFFDMPWWSYDADVRQALIAAMRAARQGETRRYDVTVKMGEDLVPLDFQIAPVRNESGRIIGLLPTGVDISARKQAEEEIRNLAFYDPLTKLPNRRLLSDRLAQAIVASKRSGLYGALIFLDLDNFKPINDTHGHNVGDMLLIKVAERLSRCVRETDTVARFGGDEFVVLLSDLDLKRTDSHAQAALIAEKILTELSMPFRLDVQKEGGASVMIEHRCPASIGVVLFQDQNECAEDVLKWADTAMYRAKQGAGDPIQFHEAISG